MADARSAALAVVGTRELWASAGLSSEACVDDG